MSDEPVSPRSPAAYAVAILGTFLIVAALVWFVRQQVKPAPIDQNRIAERSKALAEIRAAETLALNTPGWVDQGKGIVRLPITNAMEIVLRNWQHPAAARSNLVGRVQKATAVAPEKPSQFE